MTGISPSDAETQDQPQQHEGVVVHLPLFREAALEFSAKRLQGRALGAVPPPTQVLFATLSAATLLGLTSLALVPFPDLVRAWGTVVSSAGEAEVRALQAGTLMQLFVAEGDTIRRGAPLAQLQLSADPSSENLSAQAATLVDQMNISNASAATVRLDRHDEQNALREKVHALQLQLSEIDRQAQLRRERIDLARQTLSRSDELAKAGYISKIAMEARRDVVLQQETELSALMQTRAQLAGERAEAERSVRAAAVQGRQIDDLQRSQIKEYDRKLLELRANEATNLQAPINGRVRALSLHVGQPVQAGGLIATLAAEGPTQVDAFVNSSDRQKLAVGQSAEIRLATPPGGKVLPGSIVSMSDSPVAIDADVREALGVKGPVFRVTVRPRSETAPVMAPLSGSIVSITLTTRSRSLLSRLLPERY